LGYAGQSIVDPFLPTHDHIINNPQAVPRPIKRGAVHSQVSFKHNVGGGAQERPCCWVHACPTSSRTSGRHISSVQAARNAAEVAAAAAAAAEATAVAEHNAVAADIRARMAEFPGTSEPFGRKFKLPNGLLTTRTECSNPTRMGRRCVHHDPVQTQCTARCASPTHSRKDRVRTHAR
jgi:hypothetical protein